MASSTPRSTAPPRRPAPRPLLLLAISVMGCGEAVHELASVAETQRNPCPVDEVGPEGCAGGSALRDDGGRDGAPDDGGRAPPPDAPLDEAPSTTCTPTRRAAARPGLTLHLLIDASPSVALQPAWGAVHAGLSAFLRDPAHAGIHVGIGYLGASCTPSSYRTLAAPFAELPGAAATLEASLPLPLTGKALVPALRGSLELDVELAASDRAREVALVLLTDGVLDPLCGSTSALAASESAAALAASPPVRTHVLGLGAGPSLLSPVDLLPLEPLDEVAAAGGTARARRVAVELDSGADLARALDETARASLPCAVALAEGEEAISLEVAWTAPGSARAVTWPRVGSAADCGDRPGVHASADRPGRLELCPAACEAWSGAPEGRVELVRACR